VIEHDILILYLLFFLGFDDILEIVEELIEITFLQYPVEFASGLFGNLLKERDIDTGLDRTSPLIVADEIVGLSDAQCEDGHFFLLDDRQDLHRIISFVAVSIRDQDDDARIFLVLEPYLV